MKSFWNFTATLALILYWATVCPASDSVPKGLSFIGLNKDNTWQIYIVPSQGGKISSLATVHEPRNHTISLKKAMVVYTASDGTLRQFGLDRKGDEKILLTADQDNTYAQPCFNLDGSHLFFVVMKSGTSMDTDILMLKHADASTKAVVEQRSAQFEPFHGTDGYLYYSSIHCTKGCGKSIQEIWRKNLISGQARQLTLVSAVARQPVVSHDGKWLYFTSDRAGNHHIWRLSIPKGDCIPLTHGNVSDINPVLDKAGNLYFIRHTAKETKLMIKPPKQTERVLPLPSSIKNIRDLRVNT